MKPYSLRDLFQLFSFLSVLLVIGSVGAGETGSISFFQMVLQVALFSLLGYTCAKISRIRAALRLRRRRKAALRRQQTARAATAPHAA